MKSFNTALLHSGNSFMRCLLPVDSRVKVGSRITLKDAEDTEREWQVLELGEPVNPHFVHRDWHNNI